MGVYDSVQVPCPECGEIREFQSKSGACVMGWYSLSDAPADVMEDVNRHGERSCRKCGTVFLVDALNREAVRAEF